MSTRIGNNDSQSCLLNIPREVRVGVYIATVTLVALAVIFSIQALIAKPPALGHYAFVPMTISVPLLLGLLLVGKYLLKKTESPPESEVNNPPQKSLKPAQKTNTPKKIDHGIALAADHAATLGDLETIRGFLAAQKPFNLSHTLAKAVGYGHAQLCAFLLEQGADPREKGDICFPAIHTLFMCNDPQKEFETLCVFLEKDPTLVSGKLGVTDASPLHLAIHKQDSLAKVKLLIAHGADVNAVNRDGASPLLRAVTNIYGGPNIEVIECLMQAGARVFPDNKGETFETLAKKWHTEWFNKPDIQERLKKCGALPH